MLLEIDELSVAYGDYQVLWNISLSVQEGETVALLGPNGSGKSTVVNAISGLVKPTAGDIRLSGKSLLAEPTHARASYGVAHVLERQAVFPDLTVFQNLILGAYHAAARERREVNLLRVYKLFPRLFDRKGQYAKSLSGGEQQMLALARGLMSLPKLLIVDEPFLGLAPQIIKQLTDVFKTLADEGIAILFIEQNVNLSLSIASRGVILESGRVVVSGEASSLLHNDHVRRIFLGG